MSILAEVKPEAKPGVFRMEVKCETEEVAAQVVQLMINGLKPRDARRVSIRKIAEVA